MEDDSKSAPPAAAKRPKVAPFVPPLRLPEIVEDGDVVSRPEGASSAVELDSSTVHAPEKHDGALSVPAGLVMVQETFWIDVFAIDENAFPPRNQYNDSAIMEIANSIHANGQRDAIHVIPNPSKPGRFIIGDGWTRVQAIRARDLQERKVKAVIHYDLTEQQAAWLGYAENEERRAHSDYDRALFFKKFRSSGWTWDQIATETGIPIGTLYQYGAYDSLDVDLIDFAKQYPEKVTVNAVSHFKRLTDLKGRDYALEVCKNFVEEDETFRWLKQKVELAIGSSEKKAGRKKSQVNFQRRFPNGHFRLRTDGQVEITGTISPERLEEFNALIEKSLAPFFVGQDDGIEPSAPTSSTQE
ncbi:ParB/RepB/Spo0J family partition protein [Acidovorax sp. LjRoot194]|uniref:ParB/RepB/Spo0J family partition protein n=1 Tax=Acidovorax sp. LjRoot194 TaxID=3342280 RepID=UPI003F50AFBE